MSRLKNRFSEAFLRQVLDTLDANPLGCTIAQVVAVTRKQPESCKKALRIVGDKTWGGNRTSPAEYMRHVDAEERLADHCVGDVSKTAPEPPALNYAVEGMCAGCSCDPDPTLFEMREGRPVLTACPRATVAGSPWFVVASTGAGVGSMRATVLPPPAPELRRRAVLRALRRSEEPLELSDLRAATFLADEALAEALDALQAGGTVVRLVRTRPGSAGRAVVAVFALVSTLPDPLRAS
jgi:hypothetical protein